MRDGDTDFAYEIPGVARFRVNCFVDRRGPCGVMRRGSARPGRAVAAAGDSLDPEPMGRARAWDRGVAIGPDLAGMTMTELVGLHAYLSRLTAATQ